MTATYDTPLPTVGPLDAMRHALQGRALGSRVSRNELGAELLAAGVTAAQMGGCFQAARYAGLLTPIGYCVARHGEAHGRPVRVYAVTGR